MIFALTVDGGDFMSCNMGGYYGFDIEASKMAMKRRYMDLVKKYGRREAERILKARRKAEGR